MQLHARIKEIRHHLVNEDRADWFALRLHRSEMSGDALDDSRIDSILNPEGSETDGRNQRQRDIQATGPVEAEAPTPGLFYSFEGDWFQHQRYGWGFKFTSARMQTPVLQPEVVCYLLRFQGIGEATANALWHAYGEAAVDTLADDPARVARDIRGLTLAKANQIARDLNDERQHRQARIGLAGLLDGRGIRNLDDLKKALLDMYGFAADQKIRREPYMLTSFQGVGFQIADRLYLDLGGDPHSNERIRRAAQFHCQQLSGVWMDRRELNDKLFRTVTVNQIGEALEEGVEEKLLARELLDGKTAYADGARSRQEESLAQLLAGAIREQEEFPSTFWPDPRTLARRPGQREGCTSHQVLQLQQAFASRVCCLSGLPGCGKTTVVAYVLREILNRMNGRVQINAACFTGLAAGRLNEAFHEANVPIAATTIHSLLNGRPSANSSGESWRWTYDQENPLPCDFLVIDETSMISLPLANAVMNARRRGGHVLFVGDEEQLPPVGAGAPFRDMLQILPTGKLIEPHRNGGRIARECKRLREDGEIHFSYREDRQAAFPENLLLAPAGNNIELAAQTQAAIHYYRQNGFSLGDIQVICATNRCREQMNELLAPMFVENRQPATRFAEGDRIVCRRNQWLEPEPGTEGAAVETRGQDEQVTWVANGDVGYVQELIPASSRMVVEFPFPWRRVVRVSELDTDFSLAYALTVHRAQGSQFPLVIAAIDDSWGARHMLDRHWLMTAISRARDLTVVIGRPNTVHQAASRSNLEQRRTLLVDRTRGLLHEQEEEIA